MKKVLITGMGTMQNRPKCWETQPMGLVQVHGSLTRALELLGFEVTHRPVQIFEDLSSFDKIFCYLNQATSYQATYLPNVLWLLSVRDDVILTVDDWQVSGIFRGMVQAKTDREYLLPSRIKYNMDKWADKNKSEQLYTDLKDIFIEAGTKVVNKEFKFLYHAVQGGDPQSLFKAIPGFTQGYPSDKVFRWNNMPLHVNHPVQLQEPKKIFNFASLVQNKTFSWLKKIGATPDGYLNGWPIEMMGNKKMGQSRITEPEFAQHIAGTWGVLAPGYYHAKSGWLRPKLRQAADAGVILLTVRDEAKVLGAPWELDPVHLTYATPDELHAIAKYQKQYLYDVHHPDDVGMELQHIQAVLDD